MSPLSSKKSVTLADVAKAAGISKTTASHALNGKGEVSPATRQAVQKLALEMGFQADPLAQRLSNGRCNKTVGVYSLDLDLSGRTRQLQIIQGELNGRGYSVPIFVYGYSGREVLENQLELMNNLLAQRPRAVICNTSGVRVEVLERLQRFVDEGGVAVCYGYTEQVAMRCDQVVYQEGESFYEATRYLCKLGHRDIGFFNVGQRTPEGAILEGFTQALEEVGAKVRPEWLFSNTGEHRYENDGARLAAEFLALPKRPSAMVIANDYAAVAFLAGVVRAGVRVPEDLSVVGHDDDAIAPFGMVPLTTISDHSELIARRVIELLDSRLLNDFSGEPRLVSVRGELVPRASCAPYLV